MTRSTFGNDITNNQNNGEDPNAIPPHIARIGGTKTFSCTAGKAIIRVVSRCEDAKENNMLDLSKCQLVHVPDAVYHIMRHTELKKCDLSSNEITKITPKFAVHFSLISDLNLSNNRLSKLPEEIVTLELLERMDISHNKFIVLPSMIFKMEKLKEVKANNNAIIEVDTDKMSTCSNLESIDLRYNPLTSSNYQRIMAIKIDFKMEITNPDEDEW